MLKDVFAENFPLSSVRTPGDSSFKFSDTVYLSAVIAHLKDERLAREIDVARLTRKAALKRHVIHHAETGGFIPDSVQLRAWSRALGIAWEDLWRDTMIKLARGWTPAPLQDS